MDMVSFLGPLLFSTDLAEAFCGGAGGVFLSLNF